MSSKLVKVKPNVLIGDDMDALIEKCARAMSGFPLHTYKARCQRLAQLMVKTSTGCGFKQEHETEVRDLLTNKHWQPEPVPRVEITLFPRR